MNSVLTSTLQESIVIFIPGCSVSQKIITCEDRRGVTEGPSTEHQGLTTERSAFNTRATTGSERRYPQAESQSQVSYGE
jgi:hypothetical protein